MESFDGSRIAYSVYTAMAIGVRPLLLDMLKLKTLEKVSFMQELRLLRGQSDYAFTSAEFLRKIASKTLLPDAPDEEIDRLVSSDSFNVSVHVRPVNDRKRSEGPTTVLLATLEGQEPQIPSRDYVGLPPEWFEKRRVPYFDPLTVSVDAQDVLHWKNYGRKLRESAQASSGKPNDKPDSYNFFNEDAIAEILSKKFSREI